MSRTDRHRPYRVQAADPFEQRFYFFDQGVRWGWRKVFWFRDCNCRSYGCCKSWRLAENRKRRREGRAIARKSDHIGDLDG